MHRRRLGHPARVQVGVGEVVAGPERAGVLRPQRGGPEPERLLVHRRRLGHPARGQVGVGEVVAYRERIGVLRPQLLGEPLEGRLDQGDGLA